MTRMPSCLTSKKPNSIFMAKSPLSTASQPPHRMTRLLLETRWLGQIALVLFLSMALLSYSPSDPCWTHAVQAKSIANWGGRAGSWTADLLFLVRFFVVVVVCMAGEAHCGWISAHHAHIRARRRKNRTRARRHARRMD